MSPEKILSWLELNQTQARITSEMQKSKKQRDLWLARVAAIDALIHQFKTLNA